MNCEIHSKATFYLHSMELFLTIDFSTYPILEAPEYCFKAETHIQLFLTS